MQIGKIIGSASWCLLLVLFLSPHSMKAGSGNKKNVDYNQSGDSLQILDSLVKAYKVNNSRLSLSYAHKALSFAKRINTNEALIKAYTVMGIAFTQFAKDSSSYYYNEALKLIDQSNSIVQRPRIIYDIALLYNAAYNYKSTLVLLDSTIKLSRISNDYKLLSNAYNSIGNLKYETKDYTGSRQMYKYAFNIAQEHLLYDEMGNAMGNLGKFEKDPDTFIKMQKKAIRLLMKNPGNEGEIAKLYINIGYMSSNPDSAISYYKSALNITNNGNYPFVEMGAYNNMVYSYLAKGEIHLAEQCLTDHAIPIAIKENNKDWLSTLYDSYADILKAEGKYKEEAETRQKSMEYRAEADLETGSEQVRLLASLLDLKNKDQEILVQHSRLKQARLWLTISGLLIIIGTFLFVLLFQRNRIKLQRQRIGTANKIIEMEENEKGRIARELHDITGQMVLSISEEIENINFPDPQSKSFLIEKIEKIGENLRALSHHMNKAMIDRYDVNELVTGLCEDFYNLTGLIINLELPEKDYELLPETVLHIYRIIQELLMNASKYCKGEMVRIRITVINQKINISYIDNGPGFNTENVKGKGMGIMNIFERAKLIGGNAVLDSSPGSGTSWKISIPINKTQSWYKK